MRSMSTAFEPVHVIRPMDSTATDWRICQLLSGQPATSTPTNASKPISQVQLRCVPESVGDSLYVLRSGTAGTAALYGRTRSHRLHFGPSRSWRGQ